MALVNGAMPMFTIATGVADRFRRKREEEKRSDRENKELGCRHVNVRTGVRCRENVEGNKAYCPKHRDFH